jgi:signal transduction histidine kinase
VEADPSALAQIFQNLFDNSIRHVGEGGRIELNISRGPEITEIAVSDDGAGIPPEDLGRIFERFYRADPARSRAEGGTGLGLSIVRHLTSAMGGDVRAESEVGAGTTIRFTLPSAA